MSINDGLLLADRLVNINKAEEAWIWERTGIDK